jgi:hypothetical protein
MESEVENWIIYSSFGLKFNPKPKNKKAESVLASYFSSYLFFNAVNCKDDC